LDWRQNDGKEFIHPTEGFLWWALTGNKPADALDAQVDSGVIADIVSVAEDVGATREELEIAIAVCLVESGCRELSHGDRDSIGAFQQRPSQSWPNTVDTQQQARAFFEGHSTNRGLLDYRGSALSPNDKAQRVQRSATPRAYGRRMDEAKRIVEQIIE